MPFRFLPSRWHFSSFSYRQPSVGDDGWFVGKWPVGNYALSPFSRSWYNSNGRLTRDIVIDCMDWHDRPTDGGR